MTVVGGLASIFIFFEIIDSWRIFGLNSIYISNFLSFMGFILYGGTPIVLYVTGVGLWLLRPWARSLTLIFLPILLFVFMFNFACNVARKETAMYEALAIDLLIGQFGTFFDIFLKYFLFLIVLFIYFNRPKIIDVFYPYTDKY